MNDPTAIKQRYRQFADAECKGYSGIAALARARPDQFLLGRTSFKNGRQRDELLALAHPHGGEATWL